MRSFVNISVNGYIVLEIFLLTNYISQLVFRKFETLVKNNYVSDFKSRIRLLLSFAIYGDAQQNIKELEYLPG